jgi:hypothetical protein
MGWNFFSEEVWSAKGCGVDLRQVESSMVLDCRVMQL